MPTPIPDADAHRALAELNRRGVLTSAEMQALLGKSQPTVSRLLQGLSAQVLALGTGRATRYALPHAIGGHAAQQPLWWVHEDGRVERWGTLSFIAGERLHVQATGIDVLTQARLPWFLAPLRAQGFLGRLLAQRLGVLGLDANPERWPLEHVLLAALQLHDAPGAIVLGEPTPGSAATSSDYDALARDVAATLPAGSSAGGEQAKFLTRAADGRHVLIKFSPPRGTPFGERWHDLLHAECMALALLREHGVPVAATRIVETTQRTYLESIRFDRVGAHGRRHVVALDAVHDAFVGGPRQHWGASCEMLVRQRRAAPELAAQASALLHFGRLIGNTDMHFGNLSLYVEPGDVARGRFRMAPLYDMLPMRWRPDVVSGGLDLAPIEPDATALHSAARPLALTFWERVAGQTAISRAFRDLARTMAERLRVGPSASA
jgi:hypothetical protein